jgi:MFS family permease
VTSTSVAEAPGTGAAAVFANRPFLLLWLAQAATQIGGNMVLYGLTVVVARYSNSAVSALILTFLAPAVLFSAVAGVYVDRVDRRLILIVTNVLRGAMFIALFFAGDHLLAILLLNIAVSTVTVFFAPAEAAMIPFLVPRRQLIAANGIFTLTLNAAFALGFALIGPLTVTLAGAPALILIVAALYFVAAIFCWTLPRSVPTAPGTAKSGGALHDAERAVGSTFSQLREGLAFIRSHRGITWSLIYLGIAASLVGVLGVLGPDFAQTTLGLSEKDFVVVVLPLGTGIVMGILLLNAYGRYLPRRRVIEVALVALGILLAALSIAGPISQFLRRADASAGAVDLSAITSLLAVVVFIAFLAGIAYGLVAIPAQTQLQEDLPEDVRGRVFGVLNMLVSVSSFLPIIVVGPVSDLVGTAAVIFVCALVIGISGVVSIIQRGPLRPSEHLSRTEGVVPGAAVDPIGVVTHTEPLPWDPDEPDDEGIAPWIRAAGWARAKREQLSTTVGRPGGDAQPVELVAADPFGLAPDDPHAIARAETESIELPWDEDDAEAMPPTTAPGKEPTASTHEPEPPEGARPDQRG